MTPQVHWVLQNMRLRHQLVTILSEYLKGLLGGGFGLVGRVKE